MTQRIDRELPVEPGQSFVVDAFKPADALGIASLFYSVYGPEYPFDTFYLPERIIEENTNGNIYSAVARTAQGDIIGHGAFFRSSPPNRALYELGQYMVLKSYRHSFAAYKINKFLVEVVMPGIPMCGFFGEAVTHHVSTQKICVSVGAKEVALELDLMPAESYEKDAGTSQRVACLTCYRSIRDQPQGVQVPAVYQKAFEYLSSDLGLDRQYIAATAQPPADARSRIDTRFFRHANVGRCNVMSLGTDFPKVLNDFESQAETEQALVCQFFLNLQQPGVGSAVDLLRSRGYCLGGYLPRWFDTDGLLMQKLKNPPAFDAIKLLTDHARGLLQLVRQDWEQTHL